MARPSSSHMMIGVTIKSDLFLNVSTRNRVDLHRQDQQPMERVTPMPPHPRLDCHQHVTKTCATGVPQEITIDFDMLP
uniref:Uncharacterized protein n=1 Tax=Oryza meridionalis TaxID=40149 RepID=A0A0E0EPQ9_9ORYZ